MRIDPVYRPTAAMGAYNAAGGHGPSSHISYTKRPDSAEFSSGAAELRRTEEAVRRTSDVRAERVAEIKAQVQAGTYQIDNLALAEKLISVL